ncbi:hypothetical protein NL676_009205 [Syzygium grande]|nr:hypothetical protein NL676_009205 [Syzygium grande]
MYARGFSIAWADNNSYWKWVTEKDVPSDAVLVEMAELLKVCWLEVHSKFDVSNLCQATTYEVVFVIKLASSGDGWEVPVNFRVTLPGGNNQERQENLKEKPREEWIEITAGEVNTLECKEGEMEGPQFGPDRAKSEEDPKHSGRVKCPASPPFPLPLCWFQKLLERKGIRNSAFTPVASRRQPIYLDRIRSHHHHRLRQGLICFEDAGHRRKGSHAGEQQGSQQCSPSNPCKAAVAEPEDENAYASFQGLLALACITGSNADEARGLCKKCGRVGHLTFQCRNFLSMKDDMEKDPEAVQAVFTSLPGLDKLKGSANKLNGKTGAESEDDSEEEDESESSDSDADSEIGRLIAKRGGKKVSSKGSKEDSLKKKKRRDDSEDDDMDSDPGEREKREVKEEKERKEKK